MINAEYFRRQAAKLQKLAESIGDRRRAQSISAMAADFLARAEALQNGEGVQVVVPAGSSSDGEMDRD